MATSTTFTTLQEDVRNYLERGGSSTADPAVYEQIPRLINLAERRIALELKVEGFKRVVTTTFEDGVAVYDKPDRWRKTRAIFIGTGTSNETRVALLPRGYEYCQSYWPDRTQTEQPEYYADYDYDHWLIAPTPDADYPVEISYYELPPLLDEETQSNWTTEIVPQLLLYATLLEATPYLKNDERIPVWQSMYDRAAAMVNGEDIARMLDSAAVREGA